jgi:hypothetical protein
MKRLYLILGLVLALAGCGEHQETRQARLYGPEAYRIAGDTTAWSNPPFNGDQQAWRQEMDQRARLQNEYQRIR